MTISKLHKLLGKLIAEGHGRKTVDINKRTFTHPLEGDGVSILPVEAIELKNYAVSDDDGGSKVTSRGVEITRTSLVLTGGRGTADMCEAAAERCLRVVRRK